MSPPRPHTALIYFSLGHLLLKEEYTLLLLFYAPLITYVIQSQMDALGLSQSGKESLGDKTTRQEKVSVP